MTEGAELSLRGYWTVIEDAYLDYIREWEAAGERIVPSVTNEKGARLPGDDAAVEDR